MNHTVSDFVIRIKNSAQAGRRRVILPYSRMGKTIGKILLEENFLEELKEEKSGNIKTLVAKIKFERRKPVINGVSVVSKPSLRIYAKAKNIRKIKKGLEVAVISTNQGVMTHREAIKKGKGGEVLFKIW